jgi:hypothetical protein
MKKTILLIVAVLTIGYIIFDKIGDIGLTKEFTQKQDSLVQAVDSMKLDIAKDDAIIDSLVVVSNHIAKPAMRPTLAPFVNELADFKPTSNIISPAFEIPAINKPIIKITIEISTKEKAFFEFLFKFFILNFVFVFINFL